MAKPIGPKSQLIRQALRDHPDKANKELAQMLNAAPERKADKIKVHAGDVAMQKQAMKRLDSARPKAKRGRRAGKVARPGTAMAGRGAQASPVDVIDKTFALAEECGGFEKLKSLVDRLSGVR
jgi:hypothetical protein